MSKKLNFIKSTKGYLVKHSPEILTGIGITGMITSTILAVSATPKALKLIEERNKYETEINEDFIKLGTLETIKTAWKPYIPAVITCAASITCIIGASAVNAKRNAALATAYTLSESALIKYRDKVVETIGEKKEKEIREKVAQDDVNRKPISNSQVFITPKGNTLFMDSVSGRYFKSDMDKIKKVVNELNRQMVYQHYISLNEFYYEIGLEPIKNGSVLGWNLDGGYIEPEFSTCLADNDEPCIVLDYLVAPRYDYDKLM